MKMPWNKEKKPKGRGAARTAEAKLKEQTVRVDTLLARTFLEYLKSHPTFAEEIAKGRFLPAMPGEPMGAGDSSDGFIERIREVKEVMGVVRQEFGQDSNSMLKDVLDSEVGKTMAQGVMEMITKAQAGQVQTEPQPRIEERPMPALPEPPPQPSVEEQQDGIFSFAARAFVLSPKELAEQIYNARDKPDDIRAAIWQAVSEWELDEILDEKLPELLANPLYAFLRPLVVELQGARRTWCACVFDELKALMPEPEFTEEVEDEPIV